MKNPFATALFSSLVCLTNSVFCMADDPKLSRDKEEKETKQDGPMTPELQALQKQLDAMPTEKLKQTLAMQKADLAQWIKKTNFNPPGPEGGKSQNGARASKQRGRPTIGKRKEAELMTEYVPWKAKIDLIEQTLRERERAEKKATAKKDK